MSFCGSLCTSKTNVIIMGMLMTAYSKFDTFVPCDDSADLQLDKVALALVIQRRGYISKLL